MRALSALTDKSSDAKLDVFLWARLTGMVGVLNMYLDPSLQYTWRGASEMVSKVQGCGVSRARRLREWILTFSRSGELPVHNYGQPKWNVLDDEDISQSLQSLLMSHSKGCYITASNVVVVVSGTTMQEKFSRSGISRPSISERTACRWLKRLSWRYGPMKNGIYIDGHEREDVVAYRTAFVARWKEYEKRFHTWDSNGVEHLPQNAFWVPGAGGRFRLILVTHDESVFYQNDFRKTHWIADARKATPLPKGDGQSIMISDFLTSEWGRLCDCNEFVFFFSFECTSYIDHFLDAEKPGSSSNQALIMMVILLQQGCFSRLTMLLIFLRKTPRGILRVFFSLIMPLHTRKELMMPYQQEKCLKVFLSLYFTFMGDDLWCRSQG